MVERDYHMIPPLSPNSISPPSSPVATPSPLPYGSVLMHPVFIEIFGRPIYWYGVLTAVGFLAAVVHWTRLGRREGRPPGLGSELGIWVMVGGILGGRILYVLTNLSEYANPLEMLRIDKGGLVWYGGFIGGVLAIVLLALIVLLMPCQL